MRQSRFTVEEIVRIIAESELPTTSIAGTARKYGIKESTLHRWRARFKGLGTSEAKRLKVLEDENRQLIKLVADKELIIQTLNEILIAFVTNSFCLDVLKSPFFKG
jgi:putative transposase